MKTIELKSIELLKIDASPHNPREDFANDELKALADSITQHGLVQPVVVRPVTKNGRRRYQLIAGERRVRAAKIAGITTVDAIVRDLENTEAMHVQLIENLDRKDLNPIEKGEGFTLLSRPVKEGDGGQTVEDIARTFGTSTSQVNKTISLLKLPKRWRDLLSQGKVMPGHVEPLMPYLQHPEILDAVADDLETNPWAFSNRDDFKKSVRMIAEESGAEPSSRAKAARSAQSKRPTPRLSVRRPNGSADIDGSGDDAGGPSQAADYVAACIMKDVTTIDELDTIQAAVDRRRAQLQKTTARKRRKAAG